MSVLGDAGTSLNARGYALAIYPITGGSHYETSQSLLALAFCL